MVPSYVQSRAISGLLPWLLLMVVEGHVGKLHFLAVQKTFAALSVCPSAEVLWSTPNSRQIYSAFCTMR